MSLADKPHGSDMSWRTKHRFQRLCMLPEVDSTHVADDGAKQKLSQMAFSPYLSTLRRSTFANRMIHGQLTI